METRNQANMPPSESRQNLSEFARLDGAKLGLFWIVSFALFVCNFHYSFCGILWMSTMIYTPFFIAFRTRAYASTLPEGRIGYFHAYLHSVLTVFYGSLILAIAQWVYFQYFDHGTVINSYVSLLNDKEMLKGLKSLGYSKSMVEELASQLHNLRPIDIAIQILWSNLMAGIVLSITTALYASVNRRYR